MEDSDRAELSHSPRSYGATLVDAKQNNGQPFSGCPLFIGRRGQLRL